MVLVTGGTGLVGAHLLLHLVENEKQVRAIYRNLESIQKTKSLFDLYQKTALFAAVEWLPADITDIPTLEKAFLGITHVYHCAALISFDPKEEDAIRKINIEGTANIVNFCLANGVKKLCYVSSIAALGDKATYEKEITEETEWNPEKLHSDYAISKYGAEMEIWRGQQEGLQVLVVNPGVILGPGFWEQGSGLLFTKIKNGLSFYTSGNTGFVAVTDVVRILFQLMKSEISNERFTLIADNYVFRDILNSIADAYQVKRPTNEASPFMMEIFCRIDWLLSVVFQQKRKLTRATAKASYSKELYSNQKIKSVINPNFKAIPDYIKEIINMKK
ncbi:NAD-dependent epimerase/dehydratase family protein [Flavobacterium restrictum]|uniref:NAD-dependent epimerase/dehydratase family protein n=1 Tax=Flavobacterium restrictum TaxID=2594428 RepID=A0A553DT99_9FLAO|nr:NAD-dependent epimerase/dehydratase family protein [Flavobacterium restrictum]TRX35913.1 NAD-dependent epimerase/dehydratase family protein [Flavobacterium restrictum]